jgi:hypothetical protein
LRYHARFVEEKGRHDLRQPDGLERDRFDDSRSASARRGRRAADILQQ